MIDVKTKLRTVRSTMWALLSAVVSIVGLGVLFVTKYQPS